MPVKEDGKDCKININELEIFYGYSEHHTDKGGLTNGERLQLLGKAWDVHTIVRICKELTQHFIRIE